jgi:hypothetical protein
MDGFRGAPGDVAEDETSFRLMLWALLSASPEGGWGAGRFAMRLEDLCNAISLRSLSCLAAVARSTVGILLRGFCSLPS